MSFRQSITGVILAGGRGSRMGGQDKGLVPLLSKPLYQYILARLSPQVGQVIINANRNQARYRESQLTVISDLNHDFSGPLAGMQAALHYAKTEWLLFVPCDVPDFPLNLAKKMFSEKGTHLACYAQDNEREHPTFALLHNSLKTRLDDYLARGDRKLMLFMREIDAKGIIFTSESDTFINLNTPEDSRLWERQRK
ncbi:TPA: molybdenum cofactor guanylyltransferase MobA [Providencia rettgeri]|uniref:molybdenum cofactor guanylyltransferase MobA n=1 Tax=Providencia TaxID=586 RepID=UPI001B944322|nr:MULTISPECIES: molybdenum cofactor guanylyltransferase MobA [Providencia]MDK7745095.1 molybdenum cofactor guanylyltransferase MobA [Providencia rettgeri]MDK7757413.1 molybdenum cofactor guanylyltransferase MobA [Providencia rettgeri]HBC7431138.1 molybdenum cofactor guanylyltransferase MobA [Providencia rettgeri]